MADAEQTKPYRLIVRELAATRPPSPPERSGGGAACSVLGRRACSCSRVITVAALRLVRGVWLDEPRLGPAGPRPRAPDPAGGRRRPSRDPVAGRSGSRDSPPGSLLLCWWPCWPASRCCGGPPVHRVRFVAHCPGSRPTRPQRDLVTPTVAANLGAAAAGWLLAADGRFAVVVDGCVGRVALVPRRCWPWTVAARSWRRGASATPCRRRWPRTRRSSWSTPRDPTTPRTR